MALIMHEYYPATEDEPACRGVCFQCDFCERKQSDSYEYVVYLDEKAGEVSFCHDDCLYDWLENDRKSDPFEEMENFEENY